MNGREKNIKTILNIKNIFSLKYLKVLKDIIRFSKICNDNLADEEISLNSFLKK